KKNLPDLYVDPEAIQACLSNLISNAIDACVWDPSDKKDHRILVTTHRAQNGNIVFEVSDNGMGIPKENQEKVLSSFFTTKGIRGTGLGLLLTKKAVEEHGGKISFTSTSGKGTCFRIELPASQTT
ncbi:MAG: HAMP domain-containing sensor histidine kinase, partial [Pseudomonadota bacterium]